MRIKTICIIAALTWLIPIGGCNMDSAERIVAIEQTVTQLQETSGQVDVTITAIETFLADSQVLLAEPNLPADTVEQIVAGVIEAQAKLADAKTVKGKVDAVLGQWQVQLAGAGDIEGPADELKLLGQGVATIGTQLPPPYGAYAALAGGLISAVAGVVAGARKAEAAKAKTAATQGQLVKVIGSVDSLLDSDLVAEADEAKKLLAKRQGAATAAAVKGIKES